MLARHTAHLCGEVVTSGCVPLYPHIPASCGWVSRVTSLISPAWSWAWSWARNNQPILGLNTVLHIFTLHRTLSGDSGLDWPVAHCSSRTLGKQIWPCYYYGCFVMLYILPPINWYFGSHGHTGISRNGKSVPQLMEGNTCHGFKIFFGPVPILLFSSQKIRNGQRRVFAGAGDVSAMIRSTKARSSVRVSSEALNKPSA